MFPNMSALRVVQYTPKVPGSITHKLPARPSWSNSGKEPVKLLPASAKVAEDSEREKKPATLSGLAFRENPLFGAKTAADEIIEREGAELMKRHRARFQQKLPEDKSQGSHLGSGSDGGSPPAGDTDKGPGQITTREDPDDSDDDFPPLNRLLERFRRGSPEERSDTKSSVEEGNNQVLIKEISGSQESRAGSSSDQPIEIDDDNKLDLCEDLLTTEVPGAQSDGQSDHDLLRVETPLAPDRLIDESCNSDNTADTNSSSGRAKTVRFASCNIPSLGPQTPPYSSKGDGKRSMTDPESGGFDKPGDGMTLPKRQKLALRIIKKASDERSKRSPSVISDVYSLVDEYLSDDNLASNADIGILTTPYSAVGAPQICPEFVDVGQEWEYSKILGEEVVDGVTYCEVDWYPSLIPKSSVRNMEVLAEYEARKARARACGTKGKRRGRPPLLKRDIRPVINAGILAKEQQKRPRGRPRKETLKQF